MNRSAIKTEAKEALVGKRLMFLVAIIVVGVLSGIPGVGFIVGPILTAGLFVIGKEVLAKKEVRLDPLFTYFKDVEHGLKIFVVGLIVSLAVAIGMFLLIIPGIYVALKYGQAIFIMSENKDMDIFDAIKESGKLTEGYKMDLFIFVLSFIGHILLGMITFGIYLLYAMPYIMLSMHNYYLHLKALKSNSTTIIDA
ncbi:DUF975 family protein [Acholeplasma laidlawii]|uniref:DUF975 family protein n=1 Tax=Acholeplasma laidlawii TaxID=2148 RepID=UPI00084C3689|nr:DUF975 family protein [Acholeplasma laidlawii]OED58966.1 hypothetical protein BHS12_05620 [Acholeplasma laidlawii]